MSNSVIRLNTFLPKLTEKEYRDLNMLHYTFLSHFAKSGIAAFSEKESEIEAYRFGNLIDTILTHPQDFEKMYYVSITEKQLTPSQESIVDALVDAYGTTYQFLLDIPDENLLDIARSLGTYRNYGDEKLLENIKNINCLSEYSCRVEGIGKVIISKQMMDDAQHRVSELLEDKRANDLFFYEPKGPDDPIEILYQSKFIDKEENLKAMIDVLYINHSKKIIIPYDVKTSSMYTYDFNKAFVKFRYDIQADLYSYLVKKFAMQHPEFQDYRVLPFTFIVLAPNGHIFAEYNAEEYIHSDFYKENMNWRQLYNRVQWHLSTGITNVTKEVYDNGGVLKLKI